MESVFVALPTTMTLHPKRRVRARDGGWERARARSIVVFTIFCCAAKYCCVDVVENFDGSRLSLGVQLQSQMSHLFQFFIHFTDTDCTVTITTHPLHLHGYHALD